MAADYSRQIFKELERANTENDKLKYVVIPGIRKEYEAKLYDARASAAESRAALCREKDAEISALKKVIAELKDLLSAAENEVIRLKNMKNKNSKNSSKPPSSDQPWEENENDEKKKEGDEKEESEAERKAPNEYNSRKPSGKHKGGQEGHNGKCLT